jgi:hypothetical protein
MGLVRHEFKIITDAIFQARVQGGGKMLLKHLDVIQIAVDKLFELPFLFKKKLQHNPFSHPVVIRHRNQSRILKSPDSAGHFSANAFCDQIIITASDKR